MKKALFKVCLALAMVSLFLVGCSSDPTIVRHYIYLSDDMCAFKATENSPLSIKVETFPEDWKFESPANWITVDREGEYLKISVSDNEDDAERTGTVEITAGDASASIKVRQLADYSMKSRFRFLDNLHGSVISPNGRYAGGYYSSGDEETGLSLLHVVFIDLETEEITEFGPYPEALMFITSVQCVTDQGQMYGVDGNGGMKIFDVHEKNYTELQAQGYDSGTLSVGNVTADGRTWVGWSGMMTSYKPLICTDGVARELPLPEKDFRDQPVAPNVCARGISHDGSVIYGTTWDNRDFGMVYWDKEGKVHYVGEDVRKVTTIQRPTGNGDTYSYNIVSGMISWSGQYNISPNGKYLAGTYRVEALESEATGSISETMYPAFFNTETKKTTIFYEFEDASGMAVTDEGIGFIGAPSFNTGKGYVVNVETGANLGTVQEWALATYSIHLPYSGYMIYATPDNKIMWGATLRASVMGTPETPNWYVAPPIE